MWPQRRLQAARESAFMTRPWAKVNPESPAGPVLSGDFQGGSWPQPKSSILERKRIKEMSYVEYRTRNSQFQNPSSLEIATLETACANPPRLDFWLDWPGQDH